MDAKQCKQFEQQLQQLINNSGITVVDAYYILLSATLQLQLAYNQFLYNTPSTTTEENIPIIEPENPELAE